jgi:hypothetical protein
VEHLVPETLETVEVEETIPLEMLAEAEALE